MKNLRVTPRSKVRAALRQLWLRSRERSTALKACNYTCVCGKKQSTAKGREVKVEVHHTNGIDWEELIDLVYTKLLIAEYQVLCSDCHKEHHGTKDKANNT